MAGFGWAVLVLVCAAGWGWELLCLLFSCFFLACVLFWLVGGAVFVSFWFWPAVFAVFAVCF
jgi:hypothetical protein